MVNQVIPQELNKKVLILTMSISSVFVIFRSLARWYKTRSIPFAPEDLAIYTALCAFIIQCSLYLAAMPTLYHAEAVFAGEMTPYASMETDLPLMLKEFLTVLIFFWLTLWSVKACLLLTFKRLTVGLPFYERLWWWVMGFVILTFIGCVISDFLSCHSLHAWFTAGECNTPRDIVGKAASLWFALAVDLLTDLMIMAIPARLLWNLQISLQEKLAVGVVFSVGIITMVFATVRSVSLNSTTSGGQVSTQWLILWGAIEGMVAILVGCLPAFAFFIRGRVVTSSVQKFNSYPPGSGPSNDRSIKSSRQRSKLNTESMQLDDIGEGHMDSSITDGESKKSLVNETRDGQILVSHKWTQKWHNGTEEDLERQRIEKLGFGNSV